MSNHDELAKSAFQQAMLAVSRLTPETAPSEIANVAARFREAFLQFGSAGDDNLNCLDQIEVGSLAARSWQRAKVGLRLAGRDDVSLADVLWTAEGCGIPDEVRQTYPELTQSQWDAAMRMATMLCLAFEGTAANPN